MKTRNTNTNSSASLSKENTNQIKLLLVDDEAGYVNVLANRLNKRGVRVAKAYSGTEAIRILRRNDFDVAVLDLKMEDMDGIEVLKIFKKMDPDLMVIMLTGHGSEEAATYGLEMGAFDYLTKPCELAELLSKIKEAHQKRKTLLKNHE
jgi:DNA-binding response OmpR family regulator